MNAPYNRYDRVASSNACKRAYQLSQEGHTVEQIAAVFGKSDRLAFIMSVREVPQQRERTEAVIEMKRSA